MAHEIVLREAANQEAGTTAAPPVDTAVSQTVLEPGTRFRQYFEIIPGIDDEVRDCVYRIRHEVFCEDLQFEPIRADGRESDEFDTHSVHCLMRRHDSTGDLVGCTRLVLAHLEGRDHSMPFEHTCAETVDWSLLDPYLRRRHEVAEVSRLAVRRKYRQRKNESRTPISLTTDDFGSPSQPRFPHIPVGLYLASIALARRYDLKTLFVLTEPRLAQHFARLGVMIRPIGGSVRHRGVRLPSVMQVQEVIAGLKPFMLPVWEAINEQIDSYIESHWTLPQDVAFLPRTEQPKQQRARASIASGFSAKTPKLIGVVR